MKTIVPVHVREGYEVHIGAGLLREAGPLLAAVTGPRRAAVVTDDTVEKLYLAPVLESLRAAGFDPFPCVFPHGEGSKNLATLSRIVEEMAEKGLTRTDLTVALGGGVTGDMAGLAAGLYQRGIPYVQLPTTLLAAVDSSVGGKTAVDLAAGKNLVGLFKQPRLVLCDTDTFRTLPPDILAYGAAESIKYGVLEARPLFERFRGGTSEKLEEIVARCVAIKARYVEKDELDTGDRRFLNLGHTLGHAIEKLSGYTFPHGHAVAVGMVMMARAGEKEGVTRPGTAAEIASVLTENGLPVASPYGPEEIYRAALGDKKRTGGTITVIMVKEIGSCFLRTLPVEGLRELALSGKE